MKNDISTYSEEDYEGNLTSDFIKPLKAELQEVRAKLGTLSAKQNGMRMLEC